MSPIGARGCVGLRRRRSFGGRRAFADAQRDSSSRSDAVRRDCGTLGTMRNVLFLCVLVAGFGCEATPTKRPLRGAAAPAGPYSAGLDLGGLVFLAGQIGKDPVTGRLVHGGIEQETHQVMRNLGAVLHEAGLDYRDVVKASVFLVDIAEFQAMNAVYASYFPADAPPPVRTTVAVAAIPRGARVEIDFVAAR